MHTLHCHTIFKIFDTIFSSLRSTYNSSWNKLFSRSRVLIANAIAPITAHSHIQTHFKWHDYLCAQQQHRNICSTKNVSTYLGIANCTHWVSNTMSLHFSLAFYFSIVAVVVVDVVAIYLLRGEKGDTCHRTHSAQLLLPSRRHLSFSTQLNWNHCIAHCCCCYFSWTLNFSLVGFNLCVCMAADAKMISQLMAHVSIIVQPVYFRKKWLTGPIMYDIQKHIWYSSECVTNCWELRSKRYHLPENVVCPEADIGRSKWCWMRTETPSFSPHSSIHTLYTISHAIFNSTAPVTIWDDVTVYMILYILVNTWSDTNSEEEENKKRRKSRGVKIPTDA